MADFTMFKGDTKVLEVTVKDQDDAVVDISGTLIKWQLAKKSKDTTALISKSTVDGSITIVDGPNGRFNVLLEPEDTEELPAKAYYHEAEVNDGGLISTVMTGTATLVETLIPFP